MMGIFEASVLMDVEGTYSSPGAAGIGGAEGSCSCFEGGGNEGSAEA